jgi:hypothetical protein
VGKKKEKEALKAIISWAAIIIIFVLLFKACSIPASEYRQTDRMNCPYGIEGNPNADLVIKYIDSPYCIWCWFEEPILKKAVAEKGGLFMLERYDIRYCTDIVMKYRFSGTPSFVFSLKNDSKEFTHAGFIQEEELNRVICGMSGGCEE